MAVTEITEFYKKVGKSVIDHRQITVPMDEFQVVHAAMGHVEHGSIEVAVVNIEGHELSGTIRHSVNNSTPYLQVCSSEPSFTSGMSINQWICVALATDENGLRVRLST